MMTKEMNIKRLIHGLKEKNRLNLIAIQIQVLICKKLGQTGKDASHLKTED
mgnify:CR=1 FL=1